MHVGGHDRGLMCMELTSRGYTHAAVKSEARYTTIRYTHTTIHITNTTIRVMDMTIHITQCDYPHYMIRLSILHYTTIQYGIHDYPMRLLLWPNSI